MHLFQLEGLVNKPSNARLNTLIAEALKAALARKQAETATAPAKPS